MEVTTPRLRLRRAEVQQVMKKRQPMKHIATVALMLNLGVAGVYAQQRAVKMTFSGTLGPSTLSLQPNTHTDEQNLAGNGTLGPFTFRELHADPAAPQPSSTCSPGNAPHGFIFQMWPEGAYFDSRTHAF